MSAATPSHRSVSQNALTELGHARDLRFEGPWAYLAGAAFGALAAVSKAIMVVYVGDPGYILMLTAVVAAAWFGGVMGGLTALIVSAVIHASLLIVDPFGPSAAAGTSEPFKELTYVLVGVVTRAARRHPDAPRATVSRSRFARQPTWPTRSRCATSDWSSCSLRQGRASGIGTCRADGLTGRRRSTASTASTRRMTRPTTRPISRLIHEEDRERFQQAIGAAIGDVGQFDLEFRIRWPDGSVHWTRGSGRAFRDREGRPVRMVGTGQDVTERRRLEEEREPPAR